MNNPRPYWWSSIAPPRLRDDGGRGGTSESSVPRPATHVPSSPAWIGNSSLMYPDVHARIRYMERPGEPARLPVHRISEGRWCRSAYAPGEPEPGCSAGWQGPRCVRACIAHQHRSITRLRSVTETSTRALKQIPQRTCGLLRAGPRVIPHRIHVIRRYAPLGERARNNGARKCQVIPLVG